MFEIFTKRQIGQRLIQAHEMADAQRKLMKEMGEDHPLYEMLKAGFESLWELRNNLSDQFRNYGKGGSRPPGL